VHPGSAWGFAQNSSSRPAVAVEMLQVLMMIRKCGSFHPPRYCGLRELVEPSWIHVPFGEFSHSLVGGLSFYRPAVGLSLNWNDRELRGAQPPKIFGISDVVRRTERNDHTLIKSCSI